MYLKFYSLALTLIFGSFTISYAQGLSFEWATGFGDNFHDIGKSITVDGQNNIIVTGQFKNTVDFDPSMNSNTLTSQGYDDYFIQKLDAAGNLIWVKGVGGNQAAVSEKAVITDGLNNIYVVGWYNGTVDFDPDPVNTYWMTSTVNTANIFIQKLDAAGNFLWAINFGPTSSATAYGITVDNLNNLYVVGQFSGNIDFDPGTGNTNLFTTTNSSDAFVAKYSPLGTLEWAHSFGSSWGVDYGYSISTDAANNVYFTGFFEGTVDFDPSADTNAITSNGAKDIYVVKLSSNGDLIWVHTFGSAADDYGVSITNNQLGDVYLTGEFSGTVDFDPGTANVPLTVVNGSFNVYVLKLDSAGNFGWVNGLATSYYYADNKIICDQSNNVLLTGHFSGTVDFNSGIGQDSLTAVGSTDFFVQKLNSSGDLIWVGHMGSIYADRGNGIAVDQSNGVYVTGSYQAPIDVDPSTNTYTLNNTGGDDAFVLKLNQCLNTEDSIAIQICNDTVYTSPSGKVWTNDGIYYDTIANSAGCDSFITVNLSFFNIDNSLALNGTTILANQTGANYQWVDCNNGNSPIPGATGQSFSPDANGLYAVEININNCTLLSTCVAIVNVGIHQAYSLSNIRLYPNPAGNQTSITGLNPKANINIYNGLGQLVMVDIANNNGKAVLDLSPLNTGIYYLKLETGLSLKLIKY